MFDWLYLKMLKVNLLFQFCPGIGFHCLVGAGSVVRGTLEFAVLQCWIIFLVVIR